MTLKEQAQAEKLFDRWSHFVDCATNEDGRKLTEEELQEWSESPEPLLKCAFCGNTYPIGTTSCRPCCDYKGIGPSIPDWND